jgi:hydrogenase maturation protein HypF
MARRFGRKGEQVLECIASRRGGVMTTSCGRLFDGVAALLGLGDLNQFEGEMPMRLQAEAEKARPGSRTYPYVIDRRDGMAVLNMLPAVEAMLADKAGRAEKAYAFHFTLAQALQAMSCHCLAAAPAVKKIALTGGVMQNLLLLRLSSKLLAENGFQPLHHAQVPANDGGLSLGQAALAAAKYRKE